MAAATACDVGQAFHDRGTAATFRQADAPILRDFLTERGDSRPRASRHSGDGARPRAVTRNVELHEA